MGIRPFIEKPEPVVITIFTLARDFAEVLFEAVVLTSAVVTFEEGDDAVVRALVEVWSSSPCLKIFSPRPMLDITFSEGVIGKAMKNTSIRTVRTTKLPHESRVIFVD